jgi:hypothetical protein
MADGLVPGGWWLRRLQVTKFTGDRSYHTLESDESGAPFGVQRATSNKIDKKPKKQEAEQEAGCSEQ